MNVIIIKGQKYYPYDSYDSWEEALKKAKSFKKKTKKIYGKATSYYIMQTEEGLFFPETKYKLYMNMVQKLW